MVCSLSSLVTLAECRHCLVEYQLVHDDVVGDGARDGESSPAIDLVRPWVNFWETVEETSVEIWGIVLVMLVIEDVQKDDHGSCEQEVGEVQRLLHLV